MYIGCTKYNIEDVIVDIQDPLKTDNILIRGWIIEERYTIDNIDRWIQYHTNRLYVDKSSALDAVVKMSNGSNRFRIKPLYEISKKYNRVISIDRILESERKSESVNNEVSLYIVNNEIKNKYGGTRAYKDDIIIYNNYLWKIDENLITTRMWQYNKTNSSEIISNCRKIEFEDIKHLVPHLNRQVYNILKQSKQFDEYINILEGKFK